MKLVSSSKQCSMIDVDPEDVAAQLTLLDLPLFKSIQREEFVGSALSRGQSQAQRQSSCPNVLALKRQFNQVSFWAVGQILSHNSARQRAELVSHFIKTAKHLFQLNNLHSSFALVSALLSSPIYRLEKTWQSVNKKHPKDKAHFDRLRHLYSDTNNYELLRQHLAGCDLPCIPYLGVYSRDIIYLNELHHENSPQRARSTNKILESIEKFQQSQYTNLKMVKQVHEHLLSNRYLDELQRFIEDDNYRRSLEIEPPNSCQLSGCGASLAIDHRFTKHARPLHHSSSTSAITTPPDQQQQQHRLRSNMLAGLSSIVHSAVISTSSKLNNISPLVYNQSTKLSQTTVPDCSVQKPCRFLIDDSFAEDADKTNDNLSFTSSRGTDYSDHNLYLVERDHTSFPPPISTSS